MDATAKAAESPTYSVEITRNGQSLTVNVERAFLPAFSEVVVAKSESTPAPAQSVAVLSVADELQKLHDLNEKGIITDAEFQAQKMKLLGEQSDPKAAFQPSSAEPLPKNPNSNDASATPARAPAPTKATAAKKLNASPPAVVCITCQ